MMKVIQLSVGLAATALLLVGCAPSKAEYSATPIAAFRLSAGMNSVADFDAPDGKTTGSVKVVLVESDTEPGALDAELEFIDFESEHDTLTVGGSIDPREDKECFGDDGSPFRAPGGGGTVRVGGGTFDPQAFVVESDIGRLPATLRPASEYGLYEIVLHDTTGCGLVLARAALDWSA